MEQARPFMAEAGMAEAGGTCNAPHPIVQVRPGSRTVLSDGVHIESMTTASNASAMRCPSPAIEDRSTLSKHEFDWNIFSLPKVAVFVLMFLAPGLRCGFQP
jgi:hypothetical protein